MGWTMLYLFVFLKLPILALFYIVTRRTGEGRYSPDFSKSRT